MLKLAADENFNGIILRGLHRREAGVDVVRVQDVALAGADDRVILAWAAREGRVLLTHDVSTMTAFARERIRDGLPMPGMVEVPEHMPLGDAVEHILLLARCSLEGEWEGQITYLPLR
ncbi:MAG: DUF5615 family PIN-like protein [Planctomycetota bacterium]|nr:DUF5615 family PIN-like protein [Planctomycetota bacterium]